MKINNKLYIASAGSGKTTKLVKEAIQNKDKSIILLTYTLENEQEIKSSFYKNNRGIPSHVTIQTWFSFLIQHGVKPYKGNLNEKLYNIKIKGLNFCEKRSGLRYKNNKNQPVYYSEEKNFIQFYFDNNKRIYSDKVSKFVVTCNNKTNGKIIDRIEKIYDCVYIDEVQDLTGYDLEIIKLLGKSQSQIILAGDPRQATYYTHKSGKYPKYQNGKIKEFILEQCNNKQNILYLIDEETLQESHRNNKEICELSSKLYPNQPSSKPCDCKACRQETNHEGIYFIKSDEIVDYLKKYSAVQLRYSKKTKTSHITPSLNFGQSKGKTYARTLIYPTKEMLKWLINPSKQKLKDETRAKLYVAITRAKHSVAIVCDDKHEGKQTTIKKYFPFNPS